MLIVRISGGEGRKAANNFDGGFWSNFDFKNSKYSVLMVFLMK